MVSCTFVKFTYNLLKDRSITFIKAIFSYLLQCWCTNILLAFTALYSAEKPFEVFGNA